MTLLRSQFLLLALLLTLLGTAAAAESVADYKAVLTGISQQLDQAKQMEQARPGSAVPLIKKLWNDCPASLRIWSSAGPDTNADLGWVRDGLFDLQRGKDKDRIRRISLFQERLGMLETIAASERGMGQASADQAKATLQKVLEDSEYKPSFFDKLQRWIQEALVRLLSRLSVSEGAANIIGKVLMVLAVILFVAALIYLVLYLVRLYSGNPVSREKTHRAQVKSTRRPTPESILEQAERDAAAGRYREAFRGVYLASILLLDRAKLVKYTEGVTNWEYLRVLKRARSAEPAEVFSEMTIRFDEYVYGNRAVSNGDFSSTLKDYRRLEAML